mmetsp:Transcript_18843/g.27923  ORF Transcript_18843/g.27923 Transcript_18843/m.27923 type:complete len:207 (+) Transcript_18843:33-653(+)
MNYNTEVKRFGISTDDDGFVSIFVPVPVPMCIPVCTGVLFVFCINSSDECEQSLSSFVLSVRSTDGFEDAPVPVNIPHILQGTAFAFASSSSSRSVSRRLSLDKVDLKLGLRGGSSATLLKEDELSCEWYNFLADFLAALFSARKLSTLSTLVLRYDCALLEESSGLDDIPCRSANLLMKLVLLGTGLFLVLMCAISIPLSEADFN